jgi:hypothetical protein
LVIPANISFIMALWLSELVSMLLLIFPRISSRLAIFFAGDVISVPSPSPPAPPLDPPPPPPREYYTLPFQKPMLPNSSRCFGYIEQTLASSHSLHLGSRLRAPWSLMPHRLLES